MELFFLNKGKSITERTLQAHDVIKGCLLCQFFLPFVLLILLLILGIYQICQSCFEINPCDESIVRNMCNDPLHDGSAIIHAAWDDQMQSLVQIRPLPQIVLSTGFARCKPPLCRGNNCTYAHSLTEQRAWNHELYMLKTRRKLHSYIYNIYYNYFAFHILGNCRPAQIVFREVCMHKGSIYLGLYHY